MLLNRLLPGIALDILFRRRSFQNFGYRSPNGVPYRPVEETLARDFSTITLIEAQSLSTAGLCLVVVPSKTRFRFKNRTRVHLIATDLFREMIPFIEKETIHASIYQCPYVQGQTAVRHIVENLLHDRPIPKNNYLIPAIVMRSNLYLFRETRDRRPPIQDSLVANALRKAI